MLKLVDGKSGKETKKDYSLEELRELVDQGPSGACLAISRMVDSSNIPEDGRKLINTALYMLHLQILADRGVDVNRLLEEMGIK